MSRMSDAYARVTAERRACLDRRMKHRPINVMGVINRMHDDGAAWIRELGSRRAGLDDQDVGELTVLVAEDRVVENMVALVHAGASLEQALVGAVGAGIGSGLMVGVDLGLEALTKRVLAIAYEFEGQPADALAAIVQALEGNAA